MVSEHFYYQHGLLYCENVQLDDIADAVGTPTYLYSLAALQANTQRLMSAFSAFDARYHYSLKANANLTLIRELHRLGLGMDAVSAGEIYRALKVGVPAKDIVFAGVGKTRQELQYALEYDIGWFNVESLQELILLDKFAGYLGKLAQVALRLNPEVSAKTHHHIATGHEGAKFGISAEEVRHILAHQDHYPQVRIRGLHVHIGSQLGDVQETVEAVTRAQELLAPYPHLRTLNIGGGFPVAYTPDEQYPAPEAFAAALKPHLNGWQVKLEPGRYIVANAGALLVNVLYTKANGPHHFLITDGSMSDLLRPALYDAVHPVWPLVQTSDPTQPTIVTGPVCESADVLNKAAALPALKANDRLAVMMAGAYGFVMASNYNQRPRPAEVLIRDSVWEVIRRRETWEDLIACETLT